MSQLRKSSSFRSRIPVRRSRLQKRRCCHPHVGADDESEDLYFNEQNYRLRTNKSFAFENHHQRIGSQRHFRASRYKANCSCYLNDTRYSSYSSSDESCESEAPRQVLAKQCSTIAAEHPMYISTDAISLDGLLDAVSCGSSFSSPPSPVHYQNTEFPLSIRSASYESLDKYNIALEKFALADDLIQIINPIGFSASYLNRKSEEQPTSASNDKNYYANITVPVMSTGEATLANSATDAVNQHYSEKQRQLSDWYYIKSKSTVTVNPLNSGNEPCGSNEVASTMTSGDDSQALEYNPHSGAAGLQHQQRLCVNAIMPNQAQSLPRPSSSSAGGNTQKRKPIKWNNFDTAAARNAARDAPTAAIEDVYNLPSDAISRAVPGSGSLPRGYANSKLINTPPYYGPPEYSTYHNLLIEQPSVARRPQKSTSNLTAEPGVTSSVSVKQLKEHYQMQQLQRGQPQPSSRAHFSTQTEYVNASVARRKATADTSGNNKIGQQLQQWENMGNDINATNNQRKFNEKHATLLSCHQQQQQQQHQQLHPQQQHQQRQLVPPLRLSNNRSSSSCCLNEATALTSNLSKTSSNYNNESGRLQKQNYDNELNVLHHQQQQNMHSPTHESALLWPVLPPSSEEGAKVAQPTAAPRRFVPHPAATPRPVLRSKLVQKRPDETSCSSFEQLNIIGIPTVNTCRSTALESHAGGVEDGEEDAQMTANVDHVVDIAVNRPKRDVKETCSYALVDDDHLAGIVGHADTYDDDVVGDEEAKAGAVTTTIRPEIDKGSSQDLVQAQLQQQSNLRMSEMRKTKIMTPASSSDHQMKTPSLDRHEQQEKKPLQVQLQLQQNPLTRQLFGVVQDEPKTTLYRQDCDLSGSYASLECPSPPGPPICLPETQRDPQARLSNYLRNLYHELCFKEPVVPPWAIPMPPGVLCPARLEPELRLNSNSHGFSDLLTVDQILVSLQTKEGSFLEAPRRCLIECPLWASRDNLCLKILHAWAKEPPWPQKGTPVALALFIPLRELKRTFAHYVEKELLAKGPPNPFANSTGGFATAWNSLEALGPKLLIILDGYCSPKYGNSATNGFATPKKCKTGGFIGGSASAKHHHYPSDVHDLLDGKLFPEARVIITTYATGCVDLMPIVQRHIMYEGLTWGRSATIVDGGQWAGPSRLLNSIQASAHIRQAVRTPLGCLAIAAIYHSSNGDLPLEELDVVESILHCVAPSASAAIVSELGRLALFCLKMKRTLITMAEVKMYCSAPDSILGCLEKNLLYGKTAKKKPEYVFNPICPSMMEFLAANYIASLASRPGLLAAEITGMAIGDELEPELLKVLKFAMALLGEQAHILLARLTPLWLTPQIVFTLALAGGHNDSNLAALCDILGISKHPPISPLETRPLWVQVRSVPTDLMGWGMALKSTTCTLKNLEVIYQLEKQNLAESRKAIDVFLDSIVLNESVSTLRLSSLIEMDVKDSEISYLANCVSKLLLKPRLENFEIVLTLIEEDPPMLKLQSVVAALCRTIPRQPKLNSLLLDLGLSTSQLVQLCAALEKCPNITRLSLPHLRCERGAVSALSALLNVRPISFLSLPTCWGARDDPPSSSGVSMGSGSGSSTGTSCLIKQGSLPGVPSPRSYAPGIFSSLPRGVFVPQSSLGRSATLPRQPLEQTAEKRSCDSVVSKTWYPTPACEGGPHNSGTLHELFAAIRDSYSKLHGLDLSKAQLSLEDSMCLGETVRVSSTLHTLKLEGASRVSEILPSILGASESPCLQMLSIGSQRLSLDDTVVVMCARALTSCPTLRLLSLDGWNFRIEHAQTLSILRAFLSLTSIREMSLSNCRLHTALIKSGAKLSSHAFESRSVVVLKLSGAQVILADLSVLRGPQLLQYIGGFPCLRELDLSAPARSGIESTHSSPLILDDKCIVQFFHHLHSYFGLLNTLKMCNWVIHFDDFSKTMRAVAKALRNSPISHLKLDGISVLDRPKKQRNEAGFIHCFITALPHLRWMGISLSGKREDQITAIGNAVLDLKGSEIEIKLSESTIDQAKLMAQAISVDGKFDIKVSTFGTSSGILIHAEKSGIKSLTRKPKEKDQYF